jgi:hypothetical protein
MEVEANTTPIVAYTALPQQDISSLNQNFENMIGLAERLDFLDVQILRKFYMTGKEFPRDTQPYCFPILFMEMKVGHKLAICSEALRKRLDNLVSHKLLVKQKRSNPAIYEPVGGNEQVVRAMITRFFVINGLTKFM